MSRWPKRTIEQRFWESVSRCGLHDCWMWTGFVNPKGYGYFRISPRENVRSHRYSWQMHNGLIPDGIHVLHRCDNRRCVNPSHLFLGTNQDNVADRHQKGRDGVLCGEQHGRAKLSTGDVIAIRADPRHPKLIAPEFGVSPEAIKAIKYRRNWKHVPEQEPEPEGVRN